jgi:hypothetical protein
MNVSTDDIRNIPPGALRLFQCEDGKKMRSAASLITTVKRTELPDGVVDYEHQKFFDLNIIALRAMRDCDTRVLNK